MDSRAESAIGAKSSRDRVTLGNQRQPAL